MAAAPQMQNADTPMIEEHVETGLAALLDNYRSNYSPGGDVADQLDEQFVLLPKSPLPEFDHAYAKAYAAQDTTNPTRQLYAMICDPDLPYRSQAIQDLGGFANPHVVLPLAGGTVKCSHLGESRFVIFFERPHGTRLSEVMATTPRLNDAKILDQVLRPACRALVAMRERKIHHGNIHPGTFFIGEGSALGECFSAPAGTLAHYCYEPLERLMADPLGHGEANEKADTYALAIMVFEIMYGLDKIKAMPREEFIDRAIRQGVYNVFANGRDFPDAFQDMFRGILNDNPVERWGLDQLALAVDGKRFNMIAPSVAKDASRPFTFGSEAIFSRRLLANVLRHNWREVVKDVRSLKLERWCETSLHRPELGERIERLLRAGGDANASERQVTDMMTRIFVVIDPTGPLRTKTLSLRPDAIPIMLASQIQNKTPERMQLITMIDTDVASFWVQQLDTNKTPEISQAIWIFKRVKPFLEFKGLGFGIERVLYDLNPTLCCQSPLLKPYHVTTIAEVLSTLDALARSLGGETSLVDRHIAAFIASKLDITKEVRLDDLTSVPMLAENPELIMLRLLSKAQQKHARLKLVGLCAWAGMRVEKMIDQIHNRVIRKRQKLQLKKLASTGTIREVLSSIVNREVLGRDADGFAHAIALHEINYKRIEFLQNPVIVEYKSRKLGGRMAVILSYTAFVIVLMSNLTGI